MFDGPIRTPLSPTAAAAQAALDRLARNRASDKRPAQLAGVQLDPDPLKRTALTDVALGRNVAAAREARQAAHAAASGACSTADRLRARKAIKRAAQVLGRAEAALSAEQKGEALAPAVQRSDQVQDGVVLREARVASEGGKRLALVDPLDRLCRRGSITPAQRAAGLRYRQAWEMAGCDAYPIALWTEPGGGRSPPKSGNRRIEAAVGSAHELDRLRGLLGGRGAALLEHVAVQELDVASWAARHQVNAQVALGVLQMALDVVVEQHQRCNCA